MNLTEEFLGWARLFSQNDIDTRVTRPLAITRDEAMRVIASVQSDQPTPPVGQVCELFGVRCLIVKELPERGSGNG